MTLLPDGKYTKIESMNTLFLSLKSNQIDAIVTTKIVCQMAISANPEFVIADKVKIDDSSLNSPGSAVAMRKNSAALQAQISSTIKRLIDSGQMQKYVEEGCQIGRNHGAKKIRWLSNEPGVGGEFWTLALQAHICRCFLAALS